MVTSETVNVLDDLLSRLRAHGFLAQRIELPGVLILDIASAPPDTLTPGERDTAAAIRGDRGMRILGIADPRG